MKKIIFIVTLAFSVISCQNCMECTNQKLFINQEDEMEYEVEICEDDFDSKEEMDDYVSAMEEQDGVRCYKNLW